MPTFEYTATKPVNSSAVDEVYYNAETKELAVDLHDEVYVYSGVPETRFESLVGAASVGRAFREVKKDYGPSEYLGYATEVEYDKVGVPAADMSSVVAYPLRASIGTPKALVYAEDAKVTGSSDQHISLTSPEADERVLYSATVRFTVGDSGRVREHTSKIGTSWHEAIENLEEIASMLDLDFKVKEVTISFD